jgi:penicillin-binding protein 2
MLDEDVRVNGWRLGVLVVLIFAAVNLLLSRLWNVQIVNSASAQQRSEAQTTVRSRIAPARGEICDRNGVALAENRPSFDIDLYLDDIKRDYAQSHHGRLPRVELPPRKGDATDGKSHPAHDRSEIDIVKIVKESIQPISDTLGLNGVFDEKMEKDIKEHFRTYPDLPYHYMTDLNFATVANFEERNFGVTGIRISQNPQRSYPYGALAPHILGYVGTSRKQNEHLASDGTPYETVGRQGIEAIMDPQLQGDPGSRFERVSSQGYTIPDPKLNGLFTPPTMGNTLYLTIDARIQYIAETEFRKSGWTRGSVVVMDPRNGDVLALASFPDYDPNKFIPKISAKDWDTLNSDPTTPLFDRALHGQNPGSTYKIMVALAGLQSGHVTADTDFDCPGAIEIDGHLFHNSDNSAAGTMSLVNAIRVSSDVFFYQYGIRAGIQAIDAMGTRVGFGHKWGLLGDADEDAGILPGPEWMKQNEAWLRKTHNVDHWSNAQTANTAIGQGFVLCTPLQLATFLCSVANGGTVYQPRIYSHVTDYKGDTVAEIPAGTVYNTLGVKPGQLKEVQQGMYDVVETEGGTGNATAKIPGVHMGGKTGTAQHYRMVGGERMQDLTTWFYCYGPWESPRYVTCVMVEGGTWGATAAAPIAAGVMKRLFAMDGGAVETVAPLTPLEGSFAGSTVVVERTDTPATPTAVVGPNGKPVPIDEQAPEPDAPPASARASGTKHAR